MRKRIILSFIFLAVVAAAFTWWTNASTPHEEKKQDNLKPVTEEPSTEPETETVATTNVQAVNDSLTDLANFIAGIRSFKTGYLNKLVQDSSWSRYSMNIDKNWKKLDTIRYENMERWATAELGPLSSNHYNLFYPFSGPDFLNADLFFPGADSITMFGLEPVGSLPAVEKEWFKDSLGNYVGSLKKSLNNVLNLSFFITKNMFADFKANELNGATHLLLWFAARRGYSIAATHNIALDHEGNITTLKTDTAYTKSKVKGIEIVCIKDNKTKVIRYFSADISNYGFKKNPRMEKFLAAQHFSTTLVKSASYLMHAGNFSVVRNFILNNTQHFLQDDTGIPYKYFASNHQWNITLFGEYEKPIKIFLQNYQDDLKRAYDSLEIKTLPFGIGYKYRKNESTWILASKTKSLASK